MDHSPLLLDNWMPELSGLELCRKIRSFDRTIPILFCSGAVAGVHKRTAFSAGARGDIDKPFDPDELSATSRAALKIAEVDRLTA